MQATETRPQMPFAVRALNACGGALRSAGLPLLSLDPDALMARARRNTGLSDFGDPWFREPLGVLLRAFEDEAALTTLGRITARADILRLLENRLHMVDARKRNPEIAAGAIRAPLFVVGLPRTGTSILHELLGQDPENRVPMTWEVMHPWPAPETATFQTDPRIAAVDKNLARVDQLIPGFKQMHPMGALLPQECVALTAHDFASMIFTTTHSIPSYQAWLDAADLRPVYASHRRQLQYLQWRCPGERWVLKSPAHLWALDKLLGEYPDALVVQTHRDPVKVVASLASLVTTLRGMASDRIDRRTISREWSAVLANGLERSVEARSRLIKDDSRILDVYFSDFIRDEIGVVRRIYQHFGRELSATAEERMRAFLRANPSDKHGAHRYTLAEAGLDEAEERRRYAHYMERFQIAPE